MATRFSVRAGALAAAAAVAALLILIVAGPAKAERPGWYSNPSITYGSPEVGSTLGGSDGGLHCEPACAPDGPNPEYAGVYLEWVSCTAPSGGGSDRPAGGLPDDPRPCPGGVARGEAKQGQTQYVVQPADAGRYIQLHVIAKSYDCGEVNRSNGSQECRYVTANGYSGTIGPIGGSAAPAPAPAPAASATAPNMTAYPTTSGTAKEGETLTAANGTWTSSPTKYTYQWKRCAPEYTPCDAIAGATSQTYTLTQDDIGKRVQVLVTATNAKGSNAAASLPGDIVATAAVAPAHAALPTITGTVEDRQTLTAAPGTWTGTDTIEFAFQWLRCNTANKGCAAIEGATQSTYVVTRDDLTSRLAVTVTATNRGGTANATSELTDRVVPAKPRPGADRLAVTDLVTSNGLVVSDAKLASKTVRPGGTVTVTVKVTDRRGFLIGGAAVAVKGTGVRGATATTRADGTVTLRLRAGATLPKGKVVLTITVAKPGDTTLTATKRVAVAAARPASK